MGDWLQDLRSVVRSLVVRLQHLLSEAPAGSLQLTGVLGLAALVWGLYQLQAPPKRRDQSDSSGSSSARRPATGTSLPQQPKPAQSSSAAQAKPAAAPASLAEAIQSQLAGVGQITLSAPGTILAQWTPDALQESATVRPAAIPILRELANNAQVYLITHVVDDVGEATVRGALEDAGLIGPNPGQIKPHRILFCSTLEGKVSMVRQLEPELHIDGHSTTVEDLKRFMPQILHIVKPGTQPAAAGNKNVGSASLLAEVFAYVD